MDAVTYPNEKVAEAMGKHVIPVRVPHDSRPLSGDFVVTWTPTLIFLDEEGKAHYRATGFQPPEELIPLLLLGKGETHLDRGVFHEALEAFDDILEAYPNSHAAPEAVYYRGVSRYKESGKPDPLKAAYEELNSRYPESEWAKKADPYRLL